MSDTFRCRCQNCGKEFELGEQDELRCPGCFWTSSVVRLDEAAKEGPVAHPSKALTDAKVKAKKRIGQALRFLLYLALAAFVVGGLIFGLKSKSERSGAPIKPPQKTTEPQAPKKEKPAVEKIPAAEPDLSVLLSEEEKALLSNVIPIEIPRKLTDEEKEILGRKVSFSGDEGKPPVLRFWSQAQFDDFLTASQSQRQIHFPWRYERSLRKLFRDHYLRAEGLSREMDWEGARLELLNALVFPIYGNDLRLHRSVALVMLKAYIDEVLGKIKMINGFLSKQGAIQELEDLKENYEGLFVLISEENWNEALPFIERLEERAKALETRSKGTEIQYPPVMAQIDPDIQKGLMAGGETEVALSTSINSVLADLKIKKSVIRQNTTLSLEEVKSKYESAVRAIEDKRWAEAREILNTISYPSDIASDAKAKSAILTKLVGKEK